MEIDVKSCGTTNQAPRFYLSITQQTALKRTNIYYYLINIRMIFIFFTGHFLSDYAIAILGCLTNLIQESYKITYRNQEEWIQSVYLYQLN